MEIFDTHAHLLDEKFDEDREALIASLSDSGVKLVMEACTDLGYLEKLLLFVEAHPTIYGAAGLHPEELGPYALSDLDQVAAALAHPKIRAVGEAHGDTVDVLRAHRGRVVGVMHCFSGSWETARECLDMGFCLGFGGALTFKNAKKNVEVAAKAPLDRLVIETDCPYMAPVPFRGKRNDPTKTLYVLQKLAELRAMAPEDLAPVLFENGQRLFGIQ